MRSKLHAVSRPFSHVHKTLVGLGFKAVRREDQSFYRLMFRTFSNTKAYPVYVPVKTEANGQTEVHLARAYFEDELGTPEFVRAAAYCKLYEASDYLEQLTGSSKRSQDAWNSMAPDEREMAKLGKQMSGMRTNSEWMESGFIPDPLP